MVEPWKLTGRLGNQMFRDAFIYSQFLDEKIPDIYLQDYKYFDKHSEEIKKRFGDGIGFLPYISIHLRRGDYVDNPFYVDLCKTDYYEKAIAMFPNGKFLVFSDDTEFARNKFPDESKFQVIEGDNEIEDFNQMASCSHNIMANSSFSWWASYLNPNPSKTVVCPKEWFTDKIERVGIPKEWIRI